MLAAIAELLDEQSFLIFRSISKKGRRFRSPIQIRRPKEPKKRRKATSADLAKVLNIDMLRRPNAG